MLCSSCQPSCYSSSLPVLQSLQPCFQNTAAKLLLYKLENDTIIQYHHHCVRFSKAKSAKMTGFPKNNINLSLFIVCRLNIFYIFTFMALFPYKYDVGVKSPCRAKPTQLHVFAGKCEYYISCSFSTNLAFDPNITNMQLFIFFSLIYDTDAQYRRDRCHLRLYT